MDNTDHCPFCRCVVSQSEKENTINSIGGYPNAVAMVRKHRFIGNLVLFLSIVTTVVCVAVNVEFTPGFAWSIIVVLALIYANVILQFAIIGKSGYREKALGVTIMGAVIVIGIDAVTGYRGWSVNYVLPGSIILLDVGIIVLMIFNRRNWQSYITPQMIVMILSIITCIMKFTGVITSPLVTQIAVAFSVFLLLGTIIIGDRKARQELKRRFHI